MRNTHKTNEQAFIRLNWQRRFLATLKMTRGWRISKIKTPFITISITLSVLFLPSCEKIALGTAESNDPVNNFEILWEDMDRNYALFGVKGIDWNGLYDQYRPQVNNQTTNDELWGIFKQLIDELDDGHVSIYDPVKDVGFQSGSTIRNLALEEFSLGLVVDKYLDRPLTIAYEDTEAGEIVAYSQIKEKDIGYMYYNDMNNSADIAEMLPNISQHAAIIIDIRLNRGGNDSYSARIAAHFADKEELIYTSEKRNGPNHDDFGERTSFVTYKEGTEQYLKPVIVLTDAKTISAAEVFLLHMKAFDHVTQMGDTTTGAFSDTSLKRFLPIGWTYGHATQRMLLPDGTSLEGIGHAPDVYVQNTKEDIAAGNDLVMERALQYLKDEYGIE